MKKLLKSVLWFFLLVPGFGVMAQDTLVTIQGKVLPVKLLEIKNNTLYFSASTPDSAVGQVKMPEIFMIKYGNGEKEVFPQHLDRIPAAAPSRTQAQLRELGYLDASRFYSTRTAAITTGVVSFFYPPVGLIAALAAGPPRAIKPGEVSEQALLTEPLYVQAYKREAKRKKRGAAFKGFAIGTGASLALMFAVAAAAGP